MTENKCSWGLLSTYRSEIMGIACLWVMLHHNIFDWPIVMEPLKRFALYGNCGVDIFLLLSGVGLFFSFSKRPSVKTFYLRRIVRLIIPYLILAAPYWAGKDIYLQKGSFTLDITMLSFPMYGVVTTWYVGAIVVFYILYPLVYKAYFEPVRLFGRSVDNDIIGVLIPALSALACFVLMKTCGEFYENIEIGLTRSVIFLIGCKIGQWVYEKKPLKTEVFLISGIFLFFYFGLFRTTISLNDYWIRMSYAALAVAIVLLLCCFFANVQLLRFKCLLRYFGSRSLEFYLAHVLIRNVYLNYFPTPILDKWRVLDYAIVLLISVGIGEIVHRLSQIVSRIILKSK